LSKSSAAWDGGMKFIGRVLFFYQVKIRDYAQITIFQKNNSQGWGLHCYNFGVTFCRSQEAIYMAQVAVRRIMNF